MCTGSAPYGESICRSRSASFASSLHHNVLFTLFCAATHSTKMDPQAGMGTGSSSSSSSSSQPQTRALVYAVLITQVLSIALATTGEVHALSVAFPQCWLSYCLSWMQLAHKYLWELRGLYYYECYIPCSHSKHSRSSLTLVICVRLLFCRCELTGPDQPRRVCTHYPGVPQLLPTGPCVWHSQHTAAPHQAQAGPRSTQGWHSRQQQQQGQQQHRSRNGKMGAFAALLAFFCSTGLD